MKKTLHFFLVAVFMFLSSFASAQSYKVGSVALSKPSVVGGADDFAIATVTVIRSAYDGPGFIGISAFAGFDSVVLVLCDTPTLFGDCGLLAGATEVRAKIYGRFTSQDISVMVKAAASGQNDPGVTAPLQLLAPQVLLRLNPQTIIGGQGSVTARVNFDLAPRQCFGGNCFTVYVYPTSSNPAAAPVPLQVPIPLGSDFVEFEIPANAVSQQTPVSISVRYAPERDVATGGFTGITKTASLTLLPDNQTRVEIIGATNLTMSPSTKTFPHCLTQDVPRTKDLELVS